MNTTSLPAVPSTLAEWLAHMESRHPRTIDLGLDRMAQVWQALALDFSGVPIITVAGTNGKGSCVAAAVAALQAAGYRVGSYTSPHLIRYNERVCVDGKPLDDATLCQGLAQVHAAAGEVPLTYFEFGTLGALVNLAAAKLDVLILEVGLGGRLDAVNLLDADIAVITSIDLDHSDWLGEDREAIGVEKAGIARAGRPLLCGDPAPPASIADIAAATGAMLWQQGVDYGIEPAMEPAQEVMLHGRYRSGESWRWSGREPVLTGSSVVSALQALALLDITLTPAMIQAACEASLPGRLQRVRLGDMEVILDVAHNPAAAKALAARLAALPPARTVAVFGTLQDKDTAGIVQALRDHIAAWFIAELKDVDRAPPAAQLAACIHEQGIHMISVSKNLRQAWRRALSLLAPGDRLLVFGSFHVVGPVLEWLEGEQRRLQRGSR